jgi:hypothetical protein
MSVGELKKLGEKRVAAEVKRLSVKWDRLVKEFLPIQEKLFTLQCSKADVDRLVAERNRLLDELEHIGDRLVALGATRASGMRMALAPRRGSRKLSSPRPKSRQR